MAVAFRSMARPTVHLIPHVHWDREWYLPLGGFRARLTAALDRLLDQLEEDAGLASFLLDGQTILLEDYLTIRPEARERAARLVRQGRLEIGPWYVLADEQIPAGESLIRNLLLGRESAAVLGPLSGVLYSPDAFGHPAAFPLLALEFGLSSGAVWRGVDTAATGGRDLAWWRAGDGRPVLVYHLPPTGYEIGSALLVPDRALAAAWRIVAAEVVARAATGHIAVLVGADHHAPDPRLGTLAARLAAVAPEYDFRCSRLDEFLRLAGAEARGLATLSGEQRSSCGSTWTLQGVHGTRLPLKRRNSELEVRLTRLAEPLAALAGGRDGAPVLRQAWRETVAGHFHDTLCGCCHDDVARALAARLTDAEAAAQELVRTGLHRLAGHDPDLARGGTAAGSRLVVWNPAARSRGGVIAAEITFFRRDVLVGPPGVRRPRRGAGLRPFVLRGRTSGGREVVIPPQVLSSERVFERIDATRHYPRQAEVDRVRLAFPLPEAVPGLGSLRLDVSDGEEVPAEPFAFAGRRRLWNGRFELTVSNDGTVSFGAAGSTRPFSGLLRLESESDIGDTYTFCPGAGGRIQARPAGRPRLTARGPLVAGLEWAVMMRCGRAPQSAPGHGRVFLDIHAEALGDGAAARCRCRLDNAALDHRLRLRFPTGFRTGSVLAGTAFGVTGRPVAIRSAGVHPGEKPVRTAPAHRFVAVARGGRGLALLAPGFFEYERTPAGDLLFTVLRSVGELSRDNLRPRPGHAGWPTPTPEAQCLGTHVIELGIAPVTEADLAAPERLERIWEDLFVPPVPHWIREFGPAAEPPAETGVELEGEGVVLSALKPADDGRGAIFRCYNVRMAQVPAAVSVRRPVASATLVRADETPVRALPVSADGHRVEFTIEAGGLASIRLEWTE
jgi:2-O-(6-phospho-alpha-D-mannosyl)-D-glycerate hydrolase